MIEDLKRLQVIVEEGSITKAAGKLYVTQPALSHAIKRLETQLGIKILRQDGKKLVLTRKGKASLIVIERIVKLWDGLVQQKIQLEKEVCTIGIYDNAALLLASLFNTYYQKKEIDLEIIIDNSEKLFSQLVYGVLDICICVFNPEKATPQHATLISSYREKLLPVSSRTWNTTLKKIPFILYNRGSITRKYIDKEFTQKAIQPWVIAESTSPHFIKELAIRGSGVALLPENFVKEEIKNRKLKKITLPLQFERTISIYTNNTSSFSGRNKFVDEIKTQVTN